MKHDALIFKALPPERVLFVDDDKRNVAEVGENSGVCCHRVVDARGGMSEVDCAAVLAWLETLPPPPIVEQEGGP